MQDPQFKRAVREQNVLRGGGFRFESILGFEDILPKKNDSFVATLSGGRAWVNDTHFTECSQPATRWGENLVGGEIFRTF